MSTPPHYGCPFTLRPERWRQTAVGEAVPVYRRESFDGSDATTPSWRRRTKRKWLRVGTVCLDCGRYAHELHALPAGARICGEPFSAGVLGDFACPRPDGHQGLCALLGEPAAHAPPGALRG